MTYSRFERQAMWVSSTGVRKSRSKRPKRVAFAEWDLVGPVCLPVASKDSDGRHKEYQRRILQVKVN